MEGRALPQHACVFYVQLLCLLHLVNLSLDNVNSGVAACLQRCTGTHSQSLKEIGEPLLRVGVAKTRTRGQILAA